MKASWSSGGFINVSPDKKEGVEKTFRKSLCVCASCVMELLPINSHHSLSYSLLFFFLISLFLTARLSSSSCIVSFGWLLLALDDEGRDTCGLSVVISSFSLISSLRISLFRFVLFLLLLFRQKQQQHAIAEPLTFIWLPHRKRKSFFRRSFFLRLLRIVIRHSQLVRSAKAKEYRDPCVYICLSSSLYAIWKIINFK